MVGWLEGWRDGWVGGWVDGSCTSHTTRKMEFGDRGGYLSPEKTVEDFARENGWSDQTLASWWNYIFRRFTSLVSSASMMMLGFPLSGDGKDFQRSLHDFSMRFISTKASFPKESWIRKGVVTKDLQIPVQGVTKIKPHGVEGVDYNVGRLYTPTRAAASRQKRPMVVYIHGGGFCILDARMIAYDMFLMEVCHRLDIYILSINYRMSPEHTYPVPMEDAYRALTWLGEPVSQTPDNVPVEADRNQIVVMGDSAGGNLTAVLSMLYRDRSPKGVRIVHQIPIYPAFHKRPRTPCRLHPSMEFAPVLSRQAMEDFERYYRPTGISETDFARLPYVCCEHDPHGLQNLPPTTGIVAGQDILRDEGVSYFRALERAGARVEWRQWDAAVHGFMSLPGALQQNATDYIISRIETVVPCPPLSHTAKL